MSDNLRSRFVAAAPPAPVPEQRAAPPAPAEDRSRLRAPEPIVAAEGSEVASDADVVRAGGSMAIATLILQHQG